MTKKQLTLNIKNYIKDHKELQTATVKLADMEKCAGACKCDKFYVMQVIRYGKIIF